MKYHKDIFFFKNPQTWTEKNAYFLGWLLSDGHHNVKKGCFYIRLQEKDKKILEILKNIIKYEGNLSYMKRNKINLLIRKSKNIQNRWALTIYNKKMSQDLSNLGINNKKTDNLTFPPYLKKELWPHFIRSFYEGDGTVSYSYIKQHNDRLSFSLNLIATREFSDKIMNILKKELNVNFNIHKNKIYGNNNIVIRLNGYLSALKFFNYCYYNANFVLKRKFRKFIRLINYLKRKRNWRKNIKTEMETEISKAIRIAKTVYNNARY